MGRGFRLSDEPPLTPLEIYREKRRRARDKATTLSRINKEVNKELLVWLMNQRIEMLSSRQSFVTITLRRILIGTKVMVHQDLKDKPEQLPLSEIGPHGKRSGLYLPFIKK